MQVRVRHWILGFVLVALLGYWLALTAVPRAVSHARSEASPPALVADTAQEAMPRFGKGARMARQAGDVEALMAGALEGQRVLIFKDKAAMERFLARMGPGLRLLGRLDALHALRVGFSDGGDLLARLDGEDLSFIFPVDAPLPVEGGVQPGALAMGNRLRDWLGITGDNSDAGNGVLIAILDTGVTASPAFASRIRSMNLVDLPADPAAQDGHGTAVASMIIGNTALSPGVAPGAEILSIRIANDNGQSDSFLLAQGIIAAVDAGARLINISFGSEGDSLIVRKALDYAFERGALIAAAAGNNGSDQVSYPAANTGVIAVGSVDALGNHLDFSNAGNSIDLAAPGYGLNAAWTGDQTMSVSGTSFSAPIVIGAIAYIMTEAGAGNLTPAQAYEQLVAYLNDGGAAGKDPELGGGMPDIGRVLNANTPGIYDGAVASSRILEPDAGNPYGQVEILVQNRGTETLINSAVHVSTGSGVVTTNITSLAPNAAQTVRVPVSQAAGAEAGSIRVTAQVVLGGGYQDAKPSNDRRVETYVRAGSQ
jgi:hypothetical protein